MTTRPKRRFATLLLSASLTAALFAAGCSDSPGANSNVQNSDPGGTKALTSIPAVPSGASDAQINGLPGSPSATMTLDGKQIPPEPMKFGGVIEKDARQSKPWWTPR